MAIGRLGFQPPPCQDWAAKCVDYCSDTSMTHDAIATTVSRAHFPARCGGSESDDDTTSAFECVEMNGFHKSGTDSTGRAMLGRCAMLMACMCPRRLGANAYGS